jgi:glycosyltransferase involved in cell wall biosynthesis
LFAGKFENKKQPMLLIDAFKQLAAPNTHLLLAGDGALRAEIEAATHASAGAISVMPFQNQSQMPALYAAADLLVLPSVGPSETWGLAINEAMCLGTAVLVSDQVGCQLDLVTEGETGYVCSAGELQSLKAGLGRALGDDSERRRRAALASARIQHYSYAEASKGLLAALHHVLGGTSAQ